MSAGTPSRFPDHRGCSRASPRARRYFTHSYAAPVVPATAAITTYGVAFSAAVEDGLVSGVQFHPEKSGDAGLRILKNWLSHVESA